MIRRPPKPPLFPYPTLSRSAAPAAVAAQAPAAEEHAHDPDAALASAAIPPADEAYGFFNGAPGMPQADGAQAIQPAGAVAKPAAKTAAQTQQAQMESTSIRVSVAKRSEEHTSELQSPCNLVCRLLLEK